MNKTRVKKLKELWEKTFSKAPTRGEFRRAKKDFYESRK